MGLSQDGVFGVFLQKDRTVSVWNMNDSSRVGREFKRGRFGLAKPDMAQIIKNTKDVFDQTHLYVLLYSSTEAAYELYSVGKGKKRLSSKGVYSPRLLDNLYILSITKKGGLESMHLDTFWSAKREVVQFNIRLRFELPQIVAFAVDERGTEIVYLCEEGHCQIAKINFGGGFDSVQLDDVSPRCVLVHYDFDRDMVLGMVFSHEYDRVVTAWTSKRHRSNVRTIFVNVWHQPSKSLINHTYALSNERMDLVYQLQLSKGFVFILSKTLAGCQVLDLRASTGDSEGVDGDCRACYCKPWSSEEIRKMITSSDNSFFWKKSDVNGSFYSGVYYWQAGTLKEADILGTVLKVQA